MSIFDPLGLIVNFTIKGRILIQDIWRSGIGWDDSIDEDLYHTWKLWQSDLRQIENISIPRCYSVNIPEANKIELHVFCDASKKAYAVASYLRVLTKDEIDVTLVMARARVAPTKPISIPRLELQAAVMGSRLAKTIKDTLEIKIDEVFLWSDSITVLCWIKGDGSKLGQFESHRIGEIQELTNINNWNWIPSKLNSADIATRTYNKDDGNKTTYASLFKGPDFLYELDETLWPKKNIVSLEDLPYEEIEITAVTTEEESYLPDINRFSKWTPLIRVTDWMLRFVDILLDRLRRSNRVFLGQLEVSEIQKSETLWIKRCQQESFGEDIRCIAKGKPLSSKSRLKNLSPILDERGILLLSGRTNLAPEMSISANQPIILPTKHQFTRLLLQNYHENFSHQGVEAVLNDVRQRF
ncbi:uncharacterized protein LOC123673300 [Harmonia axyridis]|uniref:uncharacterized protein LOC123673300 n=1 Tax=Harmonia axyridis TaxID=115357 RepID=UPI001E277E34|nr:uncharacterized protein LOC123673300 [Harmonia axyridis]